MAELALERSLDRRHAAHRTVAWQHGITGGLIGGGLMGLFLAITMALTGDGFLRPFELIGSIWYGALTTGATVIVLGLLTHFAVAAVLGALWAYGLSYIKIEPLAAGLVFGAALWAIMQYLVLPLVGSFFLGEASDYQKFYFGAESGFALWMTLAAYLIFGISLGAYEDLADRRQERRLARAGRLPSRAEAE